MIDQELTVEIVVEMYEEKMLVLKKEIDRLNEEIQALNIQLQKAEQSHHCVVNDDTHEWGGQWHEIYTSVKPELIGTMNGIDPYRMIIGV